MISHKAMVEFWDTYVEQFDLGSSGAPQSVQGGLHPEAQDVLDTPGPIQRENGPSSV